MKFSTQTKPYSTPHAGLVSVSSIPDLKLAALRLFYALLDAWVNEYPIEPTDFARGYAETIFAMPVIPMAKHF
jgi:hypothetical protein